VLKTDVSRTWCVTQNILGALASSWSVAFGSTNPPLADQSYAIALAIDSVPGGNIMTDVSVRAEIKDYFFVETDCVTVTGNVGQIVP